MSANPFAADPRIAARHLELSTLVGPELESELARLLAARRHRPGDNLGGIITGDEAAALVESFALGDVEMLMLMALPVARSIARPPISEFFVGAVGLERETGNLILGGNVEFPGTTLGFTIHGEGFVFTRAASRGTAIAAIAIGEAHPCAHCRQYLSEFAASRDLVLIDPLGHRLTMAELYPWPFDPDYLGEVGHVAGVGTMPGLELGAERPPPSPLRGGIEGGGGAAIPDGPPATTPPREGEGDENTGASVGVSLPLAGRGQGWGSTTTGPNITDDSPTAAALLRAGRHAHAPYSRCPGAIVLELADGGLVTGFSIESVAFNPSMGPLPAAVIDLLAHGYAPSDIVGATLGTMLGGAVDYSASTAELLARLAPGVPLTTLGWA